ncbi:MAG: hypothetical protein ACE1ZY_03295, partial [Alphaproteobacteria bacterium]
ADKGAYMHYFIDYYKELDPEGMAKLKVSDLNPARLFLVDPAPIPDDELQRTYEWMKSWDFLETADEDTELVNPDVQEHGYQRAPDEAKLEAEILKSV